ncbi:MotA/TolQ/ExbB proton channel family protein [Duncaniella freteri]|uniref:MotA/TolQ/ExbB proton channel family protein n=1 Tax=Duncaniella freteri TaxID=2530391 RepID=UPI0025741561|nr:MotA/TolQ/ExbB proton channel family protein [Duncaniella freteri]
MKTLSDILFVISNALLIPVIILLLYLAMRAVWVLFCFYNEYKQKMKIAGIFRQMIQNYSPEELDLAQEQLDSPGKDCVAACFQNLLSHKDDKIYCEHLLADFQVDVQKQLSKYRILIKLGPMLGLMGTLIPMGPALVGLASGDIVSMAYNMQVAFATTVVGMAVAAIGLAALQMNKRFYARSFNDLDFVFQKITAQ